MYVKFSYFYAITSTQYFKPNIYIKLYSYFKNIRFFLQWSCFYLFLSLPHSSAFKLKNNKKIHWYNREFTNYSEDIFSHLIYPESLIKDKWVFITAWKCFNLKVFLCIPLSFLMCINLRHPDYKQMKINKICTLFKTSYETRVKVCNK